MTIAGNIDAADVIVIANSIGSYKFGNRKGKPEGSDRKEVLMTTDNVVQNYMQEGKDPSELEDAIRYGFRDPTLLQRALIHPSCGGDQNYERLEFLGDAVLELGTSDLLYNMYPDRSEGFLTRTRAATVCSESLARVARSIHLGDYLRLGGSEVRTGGRDKQTILENALEAVLGAIYLDGGFEKAKSVVSYLIRPVIEERRSSFVDYKSRLQEMIQARRKEKIEYITIGKQGPDHAPVFEVQLVLDGHPVCHAFGSSKKQAEQKAAEYYAKNFHRLY